MEFFETAKIRMSMRNPETGRYNTANVYTLEGVYNDKGELRELSMTQLVMAICLQRGTSLENRIVNLMDTMAKSTDNLSALAKLESILVAGTYNGKNWTEEDKFNGLNLNAEDRPVWRKVDANGNFTGNDATYTTLQNYLTEFGISYTIGTTTIAELITKIEEKIDSFNTISQELLIEIQSQTSKRDDTYALASNVIKSMYTQLAGNANNF